MHYCWRIAHLKGYFIVALLIQAFSAFANLWIADLAANQFLQELVDDGERGCINGVQQSIDVSMGLLKFTMVSEIIAIYELYNTVLLIDRLPWKEDAG